MSDTVTLSIPRNPAYYGVARLVVGGLAAGLSLSFDALDDLQQAIGTLLDSEDLPVAGEVTLRLNVDEQQMTASLGAFDGGSVQAAFDRSSRDGGAFSLPRLLDTFVDTVEVSSDGGGEWITLTKRVKAAV